VDAVAALAGVPSVTLRLQFSSVFAVLAALAFVIVLGAVAARLLGVRTPKWRAFVSALVGTAVGLAGAAEVTTGHSNQTAADYGLTALFGILATMVLLLAPEMLHRSGRARGADRRRGPRRRWVHPIRWLRGTLAPLSRTAEVLRVARHHGLARPQFFSAAGVATPEFGARLRLTLQEVGGMFVKFGQIASTRNDLFAPEVIEELSHLRADVAPIASELLVPLVESELGRPIDEVFASFDVDPMAAASIGQAHRAVLLQGDEVVVKVQRPGLDDLLRRDATVLRFVAGVAERRSAGARELGVRALAEELIVGMDGELDYLREAAMCDRLRTAIRHKDPTDDVVRVPRMYHELCTDRLLVMEKAEGRPIDAPGAIAGSQVPPHLLASAFLVCFLDQIFRASIFHADPHPGNLMVDEWGRLWLLDFGAVGLIDATTRRALEEIAVGLGVSDPAIVARAVRRLAGAEATADLPALESDIGQLMTKTSGGIDPAVISDVLGVMTRHGLSVPASMISLSRALLTLDGTLRVIDPQFDLASETATRAADLGPTEPDELADLLGQEVRRSLPVLRNLPEHIDEIATQLRFGRARIHVERFSGDDRRVVSTWLDRALLTLLACFGLLGSSLLLVAAGLVGRGDTRTTLQALGFIGLVVSAILAMRVVARILRRERLGADDGS
jgi:ubiquinone biosynthesis protein